MSRATVRSLLDDNIIRSASVGKRIVTTDTWIAEYQERLFHINEKRLKVQHERMLPPGIVVLGTEELAAKSSHITTTQR